MESTSTMDPGSPSNRNSSVSTVSFQSVGNSSVCWSLRVTVAVETSPPADNVTFVPSPVIFSPIWEILAQSHYALDSIGALEANHDRLFRAIHDSGRQFLTPEMVADFVDGLPKDQFDPETFRPTRTMPRETRQKLDTLLYVYQQEKNALELAKKRLELVRAAQRNANGPTGAELEINSDLLVGQMFGTLDRIRLQMSMDLMFLEQLLGGYARSSRTQDILQHF